MRKRGKGEGISLHAIAGARVVLLGVDIEQELTKGLLGFTIYKSAGANGKEHALYNGRCSKSLLTAKNAADLQREASRSDRSPIQAFLWGDYSVEAGKRYTYRVIAQYGKPGKLRAGAEASAKITTESQTKGTHGVYFNRGVAGSQAFSREFGEYRRTYLFEHNGKLEPRSLIKPTNVPDRRAYQWLSRGLEEALGEFLAQARDPTYSLRAAVYEFTYLPVIQTFVDAIERGVDVKIVHHAKEDGSYAVKMQRDPRDGTEKWRVTTTTVWEDEAKEQQEYKNRYIDRVSAGDEVYRAAKAAVGQAGLKDEKHIDKLGAMLIPRKITQISHNKFIVLLRNGKPEQVWTGSTNLTDGGIFGQYNVGHVIRDKQIAKQYLAYWKMLSTDPTKEKMTEWTAKHTPDIDGPPLEKSVTPIFSPRPKADSTMLDWYASRIAAAKQAIFLTSAFTVDESFLEVFDQTVDVNEDEAFQRYIMIETKSGLMREKFARMNKVKQNCIAWGDVYKPVKGTTNDEEETAQSAHLIESLTGLNEHVEFLHTKYLLVDPLSHDPLVITGSANFSDASTVENDENMLVIQGDTGIADTFLSEFMRLFNHFGGRNRINGMTAKRRQESEFLATDDSWTRPYFRKGSREQQQRLLFR